MEKVTRAIVNVCFVVLDDCFGHFAKKVFAISFVTQSVENVVHAVQKLECQITVVNLLVRVDA